MKHHMEDAVLLDSMADQALTEAKEVTSGLTRQALLTKTDKLEDAAEAARFSARAVADEAKSLTTKIRRELLG